MNTIVEKDRTKTKSSYRTLPLVAPFEALLLRLKEEQKENRRLFGMAKELFPLLDPKRKELVCMVVLDPIGAAAISGTCFLGQRSGASCAKTAKSKG